mmetsp:Transcript_1632/g.3083  ORF Transcript_1632/g.3083 Transcript_1632/m.3083 type:complete len:86 (+) Transcript_1632:247-504(+)
MCCSQARAPCRPAADMLHVALGSRSTMIYRRQRSHCCAQDTTDRIAGRTSGYRDDMIWCTRTRWHTLQSEMEARQFRMWMDVLYA